MRCDGNLLVFGGGKGRVVGERYKFGRGRWVIIPHRRALKLTRNDSSVLTGSD